MADISLAPSVAARLKALSMVPPLTPPLPGTTSVYAWEAPLEGKRQRGGDAKT